MDKKLVSHFMLLVTILVVGVLICYILIEATADYLEGLPKEERDAIIFKIQNDQLFTIVPFIAVLAILIAYVCFKYTNKMGEKNDG